MKQVICGWLCCLSVAAQVPAQESMAVAAGLPAGLEPAASDSVEIADLEDARNYDGGAPQWPEGHGTAIGHALQELIAASAVPEEYRDLAFEQYVDIRLLHTARNTMDCALLTDVAIQLARGEAALFRPHRLVSADALLRLAADWAFEEDDTDIIRRLQAAAQQLEKDGLSQYLASQDRLAGQSRRVTDVQLRIPVDSVTHVQYAELQFILLSLRNARLLRDWASMKALEETITGMDLSENQRRQVEMIIGETRSIEDERAEEDQATADVLNMLGADSRCDPNRGRQIAAVILQVIAAGFPPSSGSQTDDWQPQYDDWEPRYDDWR